MVNLFTLPGESRTASSFDSLVVTAKLFAVLFHILSADRLATLGKRLQEVLHLLLEMIICHDSLCEPVSKRCLEIGGGVIITDSPDSVHITQSCFAPIEKATRADAAFSITGLGNRRLVGLLLFEQLLVLSQVWEALGTPTKASAEVLIQCED